MKKVNLVANLNETIKISNWIEMSFGKLLKLNIFLFIPMARLTRLAFRESHLTKIFSSIALIKTFCAKELESADKKSQVLVVLGLGRESLLSMITS